MSEKTCKDCIHYTVCLIGACIKGATGTCMNFKNSSEWVHLPCKVGDVVFTTYHGSLSTYKVVELVVNDFLWAKLYNGDYSGEYKSKLICLNFSFNEFVFLTKEEAEKALAERRKEDGKIH